MSRLNTSFPWSNGKAGSGQLERRETSECKWKRRNLEIQPVVAGQLENQRETRLLLSQDWSIRHAAESFSPTESIQKRLNVFLGGRTKYPNPKYPSPKYLNQTQNTQSPKIPKPKIPKPNPKYPKSQNTQD